ncbi:ribosomal protein L21-like protein [Whalleya microplaca]|nr:ribosomal protein L21-like protein [Whalleya microplaca]
MSRSLLRSVLELRTPITRLPPSFLLPIRARTLTTTPQHIEPTTPPTSSSINAAVPPSPPPPPPATTLSPASPEVVPASPPSPPVMRAPISPSVAALLPLLRAQPSHYVQVHIHGRPYLVTEGDAIRLPAKIRDVRPGDVLRLNRVSVLGSRDYTLRGSPYVDEALFECRAVVLGTESEPLRIIEKTKRRNRKTRHVKSKHRYTRMRISELKILEPK